MQGIFAGFVPAFLSTPAGASSEIVPGEMEGRGVPFTLEKIAAHAPGQQIFPRADVLMGLPQLGVKSGPRTPSDDTREPTVPVSAKPVEPSDEMPVSLTPGPSETEPEIPQDGGTDVGHRDSLLEVSPTAPVPLPVAKTVQRPMPDAAATLSPERTIPAEGTLLGLAEETAPRLPPKATLAADPALKTPFAEEKGAPLSARNSPTQPLRPEATNEKVADKQAAAAEQVVASGAPARNTASDAPGKAATIRNVAAVPAWAKSRPEESRTVLAPQAEALPGKAVDRPALVDFPDAAIHGLNVSSAAKAGELPAQNIRPHGDVVPKPGKDCEDRKGVNAETKTSKRPECTQGQADLRHAPQQVAALPVSPTAAFSEGPQSQLEVPLDISDGFSEFRAGPGDVPAVSGLDRAETVRQAPVSELRPSVLARSVSSQISEVVTFPMDGSVELRLSPEELGRVRISMLPGEAGLIVQMVVERYETLELLRRHIDTLTTSLGEAGFSELEFSFSHERDDAAEDPEARENSAAVVPEPAEASIAGFLTGRRNMAPAGHLDIRL